jgi:membrane protein implicated in regulation of membrane protease activity
MMFAKWRTWRSDFERLSVSRRLLINGFTWLGTALYFTALFLVGNDNVAIALITFATAATLTAFVVFRRSAR